MEMFIKVLVKKSRFTIVGKSILPSLSCTQNNVCEVDQEPPGVGRDSTPRKKLIQIPRGMPWGIMHNHITPGLGVEVL